MLNERNVMNATCISTRGSDAARCVVYFTYFIVDPGRDSRECTEGSFVVQQSLTKDCVRFHMYNGSQAYVITSVFRCHTDVKPLILVYNIYTK